MPKHPYARRRRNWSLALGAAVLALGMLGWTVTQRASWSLARARALQEEGKFADSLPELRRALARDPGSSEARFRFGLAMLRSGEPFRALWPLQGAAASADYAFAAGRLLVTAYLQTDNYDEAVRVADGLIAQEPENAELRSLRARAQLLALRSEAALVDTRWLHAREPSNFEIAALHAAALVGAGELEEARQAYDQLKTLGLESEDPDLEALACVAPAGFADEYLLDAESALRLYEECEESSPGNRLALQLFVSFLQRSGQGERAIRLLRDNASEAPEDLGVQWLLARSLSESGDNDGAEGVLQEAASRSGSREAWRLLAEHQRTTGATRRALASLEAALAVTSEDPPQLRFQRADLLIDLGEFERAETA
ncbi:MAG: tetratricopeptide repeat protein, partial [Myxococcota bacterium]